MNKGKNYIAVDLGAESGRVILGRLESDNVKLNEIYRFENGPREVEGSLRWDFKRLFSEIKTGIKKAVEKAGGDVQSIAVDSWGVDFGLLDENGELIEDPYHYRDSRTDDMMDKAFNLMPKRELYENSGIQFMQLNTIYQLLSMRLSGSEALKNAKRLIFMADLVAYHLSGEDYNEYTLSSTSQLLNMKTGRWSDEIFDKLKLPKEIFSDTIEAGTVAGILKPELQQEFGCGEIKVVAAASHDTASAVAAVPAESENWAYLSSGTWSLMGVELKEPVINDESFEYEFTNEGGVCGTIRFLKNIIGLWILQECRRQWQAEGVDLSYDEITEMADKAEPFKAVINPDHGEFLSPGDMPEKINRYLESTGQEKNIDKGQMARVILESLALKYNVTIKSIEDIIGKKLDVLHMVGGGIKNELLCQFTADAIGKRVATGPVEATAVGNIMMQAMASGQVKSLSELRKIVSSSVEPVEYKPENPEQWAKQIEKFKELAK